MSSYHCLIYGTANVSTVCHVVCVRACVCHVVCVCVCVSEGGCVLLCGLVYMKWEVNVTHPSLCPPRNNASSLWIGGSVEPQSRYGRFEKDKNLFHYSDPNLYCNITKETKRLFLTHEADGFLTKCECSQSQSFCMTVRVFTLKTGLSSFKATLQTWERNLVSYVTAVSSPFTIKIQTFATRFVKTKKRRL
jgi:hypothetical protein